MWKANKCSHKGQIWLDLCTRQLSKQHSALGLCVSQGLQARECRENAQNRFVFSDGVSQESCLKLWWLCLEWLLLTCVFFKFQLSFVQLSHTVSIIEHRGSQGLKLSELRICCNKGWHRTSAFGALLFLILQAPCQHFNWCPQTQPENTCPSDHAATLLLRCPNQPNLPTETCGCEVVLYIAGHSSSNDEDERRIIEFIDPVRTASHWTGWVFADEVHWSPGAEVGKLLYAWYCLTTCWLHSVQFNFQIHAMWGGLRYASSGQMPESGPWTIFCGTWTSLLSIGAIFYKMLQGYGLKPTLMQFRSILARKIQWAFFNLSSENHCQHCLTLMSLIFACSGCLYYNKVSFASEDFKAPGPKRQARTSSQKGRAEWLAESMSHQEMKTWEIPQSAWPLLGILRQ